MKVGDVYTSNKWDFSNLYIEILSGTKDYLARMRLILHYASSDLIVWFGDILGEYIASLGYHWLLNQPSCDISNSCTWD